MSTTFNTVEEQVEELSTYSVNFSGPHYNDLGAELSRAWMAGDWDQSWALLRIKTTLMDAAAKDYKAEFGSMTESAEQMWPTGIRWAATCRVYDHYTEEFKLGNFF